MNFKHINVLSGALTGAVASLVAASISATIVHDMPAEPREETNYKKVAEIIPFLPEFEPVVPMDQPELRQLNQRQKRKLKRQQPHGKF